MYQPEHEDYFGELCEVVAECKTCVDGYVKFMEKEFEDDLRKEMEERVCGDTGGAHDAIG